MKHGTAALVLVFFLVIVFFIPTEDTQEAAGSGREEEAGERTASAPWFNEGDPWFVEGDELNRMSGEELRALAEQNETVRIMLEEDQKPEPVRIESLEDLEHLPENYPEELKKQIIEDYLARQNFSEETAKTSDNITESTTNEENELTTSRNEST
ncbi:TPA: hypothetical protein HA338_02265 [Methanosarcina acetivorans]|uniref:Uncharacterized protein n=2 Tax=Methanosarcina acetivorans TaxID=2214 RepID=Q8TKW7_METAC|nr:hypothetical protein [Methanosarcina acetivorans]AAM06647.1 predicted protein [Methanosarcina acetivorans C2A]HIH92899.1 hypothetical protein [Methanosarcina acetivorans]